MIYMMYTRAKARKRGEVKKKVGLKFICAELIALPCFAFYLIRGPLSPKGGTGIKLQS